MQDTRPASTPRPRRPLPPSRPNLRVAVLAALEIGGCAFRGPVQRRHRDLSRALEALDAEIAQ